jgi:hypothetical protein
VGFAQTAVDFSYEVSTCLKSQPACLRNRELCLGSCDGAGSGGLTQDFATTFVKQELSVKTIGSDGILRGRSNCSLQNRTIKVPLFYSGKECRDGGVGSVWPPVCQYGSQISLCGHREDVGRNAIIGDNSCKTAKNNQCEDGGEGTEFFGLDSEGEEYAICGFATDLDDCPLRRVDYGPLTYSDALKPPFPSPPPSPPSAPPPPPPQYTHVSCNNTCPYQQEGGSVCSDGGLGAFLVDEEFQCDYGTSCALCGARQDELTLTANLPESNAFNDFCDDTTQGGIAGYGTDTSDCGVMVVQRYKGLPIVHGFFSGRSALPSSSQRLQQLRGLLPRPPPKPPSPPPPRVPKAQGAALEALLGCDCRAYG